MGHKSGVFSQSGHFNDIFSTGTEKDGFTGVFWGIAGQLSYLNFSSTRFGVSRPGFLPAITGHAMYGPTRQYASPHPLNTIPNADPGKCVARKPDEAFSRVGIVLFYPPG